MQAPHLTALWREPKPPAPGPPASWERVTLAAFCVAVILEASWKEGVEHRFAQACGGLLMVVPLFFRLHRPLGTFSVSFALAAAVPLGVLVFGLSWTDLDSTAVILLAAYTLSRWGSGREALSGLLFLAGLYGLTLLRGQYAGLGDALGGAAALWFPSLLGITLRFRAGIVARELKTVRLQERERIARDLHDSVAHHVSAIALQAQGAIAIAGSRPEALTAVFAAIEKEAQRTLSDLRSMVGALRDATEGSVRPQAQIADIPELASENASGLRLRVALEGDASAVPSALQTAVYRIAQEGITNAQRHAKRATEVVVAVRVGPSMLTLSIVDDGLPLPVPHPHAAGYGLVGMAERTDLFGGTFHAGPHPSRGWTVDASFPLRGPRP